MDSSLRGYLSRRTDKELEYALQFCIEQKNEIYLDTIHLIYEIMAERRSGIESNDAQTEQ